ncbi:hypothetical protein HZB02_07635 [Candidatus Woesearchaeota archaeon]|nr:hypothetical protein [Candidatus Woesearchaeota archaeon]
MRFLKLRVALVIALALFVLITGNIIAFGLLQKSKDVQQTVPIERGTLLQDQKPLATSPPNETITPRSLSPVPTPVVVQESPSQQTQVRPSPPPDPTPPPPVIISHSRRTRAS